MTTGYWFWLGVLCTVGALVLLLLTRVGRKVRTVRTVHAVGLFALLAFGGFKCARDEFVRAEWLTHAPTVLTVAITRSDGGGTLRGEGDKVKSVEYRYNFGGKGYTGLTTLRERYTVERDFLPDEFNGRCLLIHVIPEKPELSRLEAVLNTCPSAPDNGWPNMPAQVRTAVDTLWWRGAEEQ